MRRAVFALVFAIVLGGASTAQADVSVKGAIAKAKKFNRRALIKATQGTAMAGLPDALSSYTGTSLNALVNGLKPKLPGVKNAPARVVVQVSDKKGKSQTIALGETDSEYGNLQAVLAFKRNGKKIKNAPELAIDGDVLKTRLLPGVTNIKVIVVKQKPTTPKTAGGLTIHGPYGTTSLSPAQMSVLPQQPVKLDIIKGTNQVSHVEIGPSLEDVLHLAGFNIDTVAYAAGVGSDGYMAAVSPREDDVGGRPQRVSFNEDGMALAQPRLVIQDDVHGGRSVGSLTDIVVGCTPALKKTPKKKAKKASTHIHHISCTKPKKKKAAKKK